MGLFRNIIYHGFIAIRMQHFEEEEDGQQERYKTITSDQDTANPTANKHNQATPTQFKRTNPFLSPARPPHHQLPSNRSHSLRESITRLQQQKQHYLEQGRYTQAGNIDQQIRRTHSLMLRADMSRIRRSQVSEKRSIKSAYVQEVSHFQRAWQEYFEQVKDKQLQILHSFKAQQKQQVSKAKQTLVRRCQSLRHYSKDLIELERKEQYYKRTGNITELQRLRAQRKEAAEKAKQQKQTMIQKWTKLEEEKLSRYQSKKYAILIKRLEENRIDQEKSYILQRKRLKQKYRNVLSQLKHQQRMSLQMATRSIALPQN